MLGFAGQASSIKHRNAILPQEDQKIAAEFDYSIAPTNINHVRLTPALGVNAEAVEAVRARRRTFMVTVFSGENTGGRKIVQVELRPVKTHACMLKKCLAAIQNF